MTEAHVIRRGDQVLAVVLGGIELAERERDRLAEAHFQTCRWGYQPPNAEHWPGRTPYEKYRNHMLYNITTVPLVDARVPTQKEVETELNANRYLHVRAQHWSSSRLCVVMNPKDAVKLGHNCPSGDLLDFEIDQDMTK